MNRLIRNIYLNISSFSINTVIGLSVIPLIIKAYGLEGYGIFVLARQLLPIGLIGFFEAGLPEATSRYVASSLAENKSELASNVTKVALVCAMIIGMTLLFCLLVFSGAVVKILSIPGRYADSFEFIIFIAAVSLPFYFAGNILRGALEGLGRFDAVRLTEVVGSIFFLVLVIALPKFNLGLNAIIISFIIIGNVRSVFYLIIAKFHFQFSFSIKKQELSDARPMLQHAMAFLESKLYSAALNNAPLVIAAYGTSSVLSAGALDAVMKIPRLLKTGCGMFGNVLLPYSAKADVEGKDFSKSNFIKFGTIILSAIIIPLVFVMGIFSEEIIINWLGIEKTNLTIWFVCSLIFPALISTVSIGNSMLVARRHAVHRLNRIAFSQVLIFYLVVIALQDFFEWEAFLLATLASTLVSVLLQHFIIRNEYNIAYSDYGAYLLRAVPSFAIVVFMKILLDSVLLPVSIFDSLVILLFCGFIMYAMTYYFVLTHEDRVLLRSLLTQFSLFKRKKVRR
jgi:O-antigen/teichoic acid export membrane protein